MLNLKILLRN